MSAGAINRGPIMRLALTAGTILILVATARADEGPQAILKRAIEVHGGAGAVNAAAGPSWYRREGTLYLDSPGGEKQTKVAITDESWTDDKGRDRGSGTAKGPGRTLTMALVF